MKKTLLLLVILIAFSCTKDRNPIEETSITTNTHISNKKATKNRRFQPINIIQENIDIQLISSNFTEQATVSMTLKYNLSSPRFGYDYSLEIGADISSLSSRKTVNKRISYNTYIDIKPIPNNGIGTITYQLPSNGDFLYINMAANANKKHFYWRIRHENSNSSINWRPSRWYYFNLIQ